MGKTLYEKIWDRHVVHQEQDQPAILYIDLHLIHEVTSPQAFDGIKSTKRSVRRPDRTLGTVDHGIPTTNRSKPFEDPIAKKQVDVIEENCKEFNIKLYNMHSPNQGIVHVIAPELGLTQPGQTIVCGDSHTPTHGAFGALAFGIGTSEVEHVLATQTLKISRSKSLLVKLGGKLPTGSTAKDVALALIGEFGHDFGTGHIIEFQGEVIQELSMEERMTICNMAIEMGARAGIIAPDEVTFDYVKGKPGAPIGHDWEEALSLWKTLYSDPDALFDKVLTFRIDEVPPQVTWGSNPSLVVPVTDSIPYPKDLPEEKQEMAQKALEYMDLQPNTAITDVYVNTVFIGSCTNSRVQDLREAAKVVQGYRVADGIRALVVPGSQLVKKQAESEGIDQIFLDAGFEWRESGCSMCLGMNPDVANPGDRIASTSNRNFEGRQGKGSRSHLVSPAMAAATAIKGHFVDVRDWKYNIAKEVQNSNVDRNDKKHSSV
ncbi:3-isopropylmalate dehydratase large subunit [Virgibacillus byunsanensis]|uniref:3-isopropylmalate dehydratase large subunit n=1 Tax=Virgibacillus byunsanensis TaxID=570945 RepID=A0ABW3LLU9_9BACI